MNTAGATGLTVATLQLWTYDQNQIESARQFTTVIPHVMGRTLLIITPETSVGVWMFLSCQVRAPCKKKKKKKARSPRSFKGFGYFKIGGQVIRTWNYTDDLVLFAQEQTAKQGMID
jgi:hypothetical protein